MTKQTTVDFWSKYDAGGLYKLAFAIRDRINVA